MAELSFELKTIEGRTLVPDRVASYELSRDIDAPCDGLRLRLDIEPNMEELTQIKAYCGDRLIFNGYVDYQKESSDGVRHSCFIYARSSACILLDNEAEPRSYLCPSAQALFVSNAESLGFKSRLPELSLGHSYLVSKGTSCYGAINNFVNGVTGKSIVVSPQNELELPSGEGRLKLDEIDVISIKRAINRGGLLSGIDYKTDSDNKYSHHMKSLFLEGRGICASRKINLSSFPVWQREYIARGSMASACKGYYRVEIVADGCVASELYDRAEGVTELGDMKDYYVTGVCMLLDSKGERTALTLCREFELEEITYVAE